jgi:hypothetical protein
VPDHSIPIDDATVWDILDYEVVVRLAKDADMTDPRSNPVAHLALRLVNAAAASDEAALRAFEQIAKHYIGKGTPNQRLVNAGLLADLFGARPVRLKAFVRRKWALLGDAK